MASEVSEDIKAMLTSLKDPELLSQLQKQGDGDCCCPTIIVYLIRADRVVIDDGGEKKDPPRGTTRQAAPVRSWVVTPSGRREITR